MIFDVLCFTCILLLVVIVGVVQSRLVGSEEGYLFAKRRVTLLPLTATLVMTELNSATLIAFSSMGYLCGLRALLLPVVFLVGLIFYALTVARKWKAFDGFSVGHFFTKRFGAPIGKIATLFLLIAMTLFSASYLKSLTMLFAPLLSINTWVVSLLFLLFSLALCLRGGLVSIIRTDVVSFFLVITFFPLVAWLMSKGVSFENASFENSQNLLPMRFVISLIVLTMFTYILAPWYGQKMFAARSRKVAFAAVLWSALLVFLVYGCAIVATASFRARGGVSGDEMAFPTLLQSALPKGLRGVGYALLLLSSATTLIGVWNAMTSLWMGDFQKREEGVRRSLMITLCFALLTFFLANLWSERVFDQVILANIPVAALSFGLLAGFYWKKASSLGVMLSLIVGVSFAIGAYFFSDQFTWVWAIYGIPSSFLVGILGSLLVYKRASSLA